MPPKLNIFAFGLAYGIYAAIMEFVLDFIAMFSDYAMKFFGFGVTIPGLIINTAISFIDGLIAGLAIAWLYNYFLQKLWREK